MTRGPTHPGRRLWLKGAAGTVAVPVVAAFASRVAAGDGASETTVKLTARRFRYEPATIALAAGELTVLEITSLDFVHGMNIPDLKMRADLPPGRVTKVRVQFDQPGEYAFLCDNFCGDDHEEMAAKFVVT
jgi:cytochrome c oxidase subunit 2